MDVYVSDLKYLGKLQNFLGSFVSVKIQRKLTSSNVACQASQVTTYSAVLKPFLFHCSLCPHKCVQYSSILRTGKIIQGDIPAFSRRSGQQEFYITWDSIVLMIYWSTQCRSLAGHEPSPKMIMLWFQKAYLLTLDD